jgi:LysM repeat protein
MNTPTSPLFPQGTFLEPKNKGRARVRVAVFVVLAVHGIGLLALLMQGCKKDNQAGTAAADQTNAMPTNVAPAFEPTNMPPAVTNTATPTTLAPVTPPEALATEYTIAPGDNFSTLSRKFHVTTKALVDANPGVEPTKLQIGQKIHIPPPAAAAVTGNGTAPPATDAASGDAIYTVKSGDTLTQIALSHHVKVTALRAENDLKTDSIKVGQKLKIPKATVPATPDAGTSAPPASSSGK